MLSDREIAAIVEETSDVEATVWSLIEAANAAGGIDNITVAVVDARS
jgi:serine/threonine protein phosphatase PrpC